MSEESNELTPVFGFTLLCLRDASGALSYQAAYLPDEDSPRKPQRHEIRDACSSMAAHMDRVMSAEIASEMVVRRLVRASAEQPQIVKANFIPKVVK